MPHRHETRSFPDGFLWGASTSAYQVEGGNRHSDWWAWEQAPGRIHDGSRSGEAADQYHRYEEDLDLAAGLGNNAHRLSVEWARIEPRAGEWDEKEIAHYRDVLTAVRKRGMKVVLTLWHFTLPQWMAERGGWAHPSAVRWYLRYVRKIAEELGDLVDLWLTMNEPVVYLSQSYISAAWPPQKKSQIKAFFIGLRLAKAHRRAYRLLHRMLDGPETRTRVGMAKSVTSFEVYRHHRIADYLLVRFLDYWWNHAAYSFTRGTHDFLGINYYFHARLKKFVWPPTAFFADLRHERRDVSDVGWEINPSGLFRALKDFEKMGLPVYITENGLATTVDDRRKRFIVGYLKELWHAVHSGVDVRGYFFWSLIDNFEWEKGYTPRFGLVEVDFKTQKRTPRGSYDVYRRICEANGLPHDVLRYVGHGSEDDEAISLSG